MRRLVLDAIVLLAAPVGRPDGSPALLIEAMVRGIATLVPDPAAPPAVLRDPADDYLVALARATTADAIVTGDRDLLDHDGLQPPAITAHAACRELGLLDD